MVYALSYRAVIQKYYDKIGTKEFSFFGVKIEVIFFNYLIYSLMYVVTH